MEYNYRRFAPQLKFDDVFSERFLYYVSRVKQSSIAPTRNVGVFLRDVLKTLVTYGICKEENCPFYIDSKFPISAAPSEASYVEAKNFQILEYARIPENKPEDILGIVKRVLAAEYVFVGGFQCFTNIFTGNVGFIPMPSKRDLPTGGHAVLFVGYDDVRGVVKFKNSWGPEWGDNGYGYLPYAYFSNGWVGDMWTVFVQEHDNKAIGIVRPIKNLDVVNANGPNAVSTVHSLPAPNPAAMQQIPTAVAAKQLKMAHVSTGGNSSTEGNPSTARPLPHPYGKNVATPNGNAPATRVNK